MVKRTILARFTLFFTQSLSRTRVNSFATNCIMEMAYWVYFTINSSNQSILPLQLIAIVRVCKKKNMADYLPKSSPAT